MCTTLKVYTVHNGITPVVVYTHTLLDCSVFHYTGRHQFITDEMRYCASKEQVIHFIITNIVKLGKLFKDVHVNSACLLLICLHI